MPHERTRATVCLVTSDSPELPTWEDRGSQAPDRLTPKENCSLDDIDSGRYRVMSIDPTVFDDPATVPVAMLYAGIGGISHGVAPYPIEANLRFIKVPAHDIQVTVTKSISHQPYRASMGTTRASR